MSYSFNVSAGSKAEAGQKVDAELRQIVEAQPLHVRDRQAAQNAAEACINALAEPGEGDAINLTVSGSLGWRCEDMLTSVNLSVYAYIAPEI